MSVKITNYFKQKFGELDFLFDSHSHLSWFDEVEQKKAVDLSLVKGVKKIIDIATDLESSKKSLEIAQKFPDKVYPTLGMDPEIVVPGSDLFSEKLGEEELEEMLADFEKLVEENHEKVIMLGETGLDYYWIEKNELEESEKRRSRELQKIIYEKHLELSAKYQIPLSIHHRDSAEDCVKFAKNYPDAFGIFHSFVGDYDEAKMILDGGFAIGINGIVTYKSAESIRQALKKILPKSISSPEDLYEKGVFLETDAPFLTPLDAKEGSNLPENISLIYDFVKKLKN